MTIRIYIVGAQNQLKNLLHYKYSTKKAVESQIFSNYCETRTTVKLSTRLIIQVEPQNIRTINKLFIAKLASWLCRCYFNLHTNVAVSNLSQKFIFLTMILFLCLLEEYVQIRP